MNSWTNRPHPDPSTAHLNLHRVKPGKPITGIVLTNDLTGAYTHYYGGRTQVCNAPNCKACDERKNARWYGYAQIWNPTTHSVAVVEVTPTCVEAIDAYMKTHGTLRGAWIKLQRVGPKLNAKLTAELREPTHSSDLLPQPADLEKYLTRLWEIRATAEAQPDRPTTPSGLRRPHATNNGRRSADSPS
jgi:hypothetical protein